MREFWRRIRAASATLWDDESGQDLVEYSMVAAVIALGAIAGMSAVAKEINDVFSNLANKIYRRGT